MSFSSRELEKLRLKVRFKVSYEVGFACPDAEDIVQETISRLLVASQNEKSGISKQPARFLMVFAGTSSQNTGDARSAMS